MHRLLYAMFVLSVFGLAGFSAAQTAERVPERVLQDGDIEVVIVRAPLPYYPKSALFFGVQGRCEVRYTLDATGRIDVNETACTSLFFCYSAKTSVENAEMYAHDQDGNRVERNGIMHPLVFQIAGWKPRSEKPVLLCKPYPIG